MNELAILLPPKGDENVDQALEVINDDAEARKCHKYQLNDETGRFELLEKKGVAFSFDDEGVVVLGIGDKTIAEIEKQHYKGFVVATACSHCADLAHSFTYYINPSCVIKTIYDAFLSNNIFAGLDFFCVVQDCKTDDIWIKRCIDQINEFNQTQCGVKCKITSQEDFSTKSDCLIYIPGYDKRAIKDLILSIFDKRRDDSSSNLYVVLDPMYCMFPNTIQNMILTKVGTNKLLYVDVPEDVGLPQGRRLNVVLGFVKEALGLAVDIVKRGGNPEVIRDIRMRPTRFGNVFFSDSGEVYHETKLLDSCDSSIVYNKMTGCTTESQLAFLLQRMDSVFACKSFNDVLGGVLALIRMWFKECQIAFHENEHTNTSFLPNQDHYFTYTDANDLRIGSPLAFLLSRMKRRHVIQLGCGAIDLSDNGAFRVFTITDKGIIADNFNNEDIQGLVVARDKKMAAYAWQHHVDGDEIALKDVVVLSDAALEEWKKFAINKVNNSYVYVIPSDSQEGVSLEPEECCYSILTVKQKLSYLDIQVLTTLVSRVFVRLHNIVYRRRIDEASVMSAIGSIMSRNGSHNIGSHVLAALSHNVGTMPDDRVLYQYIQQRMDYMASATTDFQDWSVPTSFVGELMKHFYSQYHLLEHIAGSEGLHAYRYQGKPISLVDGKGLDTHCIKVNVRRIEKKYTNGYRHCVVGELECWLHDFFNSTTDRENLEDDVSVAMPGGILGQHAFYNIVENVIRNAAKHSWTRQEGHKPNENLDIFIDLADGDFGCREHIFPEKSIARLRQMVSVTIGDGLSRIFDNVEFWRHFLCNEVAGKYITVAEENGVDSNLWLWNAYAALVKRKSEDCKKAIIEELKKKSQDEKMVYALKRAFALPISSLASDKGCEAVRDFIAEGSTTSPETLPPQYRVLYAFLLNGAAPEKRENSNTGRWIIDGNNSEEPIVFALSMPPSANSDNSSVGNRLILPLHHRQEIELSKPFIDPVSNKLKQSGWGLAEMKISAGYLRRASFDVVGGLETDKKYELPLIIPMGVPPLGKESDKNNENKEECNSQHEMRSDLLDLRLAYRIWVERPKKVLMLVDEDSTWWNWCGAKDHKSGCSVKLLSEALEKVGLMSDFGVVVIDSKQAISKEDGDKIPLWKKHWNKLPFRSVVVVNEADSTAEFPVILREKLDAAKDKIDDFVDVVYEAWLSFLRKRRNKASGDLSIRLNIYEDYGQAKGLISDIDIYKMLFRECLHSVIEPLVDDSGLDMLQRKSLLLISVFPFEINQDVFKKAKATAVASEGKMLSLELFRLWAIQVGAFLDDNGHWSKDFKSFLGVECESGNDIRESERIVSDGLLSSRKSLLNKNLVKLLKKDLAALVGVRATTEDSALQQKIVEISKSDLSNPLIEKIINAIETARVTSDVFLRKYEERIVTLPSQYQVAMVEASADDVPFCGLHLKIVRGADKADISYNRHSVDDSCLYSEPLSGSQSYLNALAKIKDTDKELAMRLAETGLLRIVIIDERVCSFIVQHDFMKPIYASMRLFVVDTERTCVDADGVLKSANMKYVVGADDLRGINQSVSNNDLNEFELLIIHQGIIDKWWPSHSKEDVRRILSNLRGASSEAKGLARFVVITTGRGRPDNIPDDEKVLPFSAIESLLFRRYPEKVTLVNTAMNILPYEKERNS